MADLHTKHPDESYSAFYCRIGHGRTYEEEAEFRKLSQAPMPLRPDRRDWIIEMPEDCLPKRKARRVELVALLEDVFQIRGARSILPRVFLYVGYDLPGEFKANHHQLILQPVTDKVCAAGRKRHRLAWDKKAEEWRGIAVWNEYTKSWRPIYNAFQATKCTRRGVF